MVVASTELKFISSALKFLQMFVQARRPHVSIALRVEKALSLFWGLGAPFRWRIMSGHRHNVYTLGRALGFLISHGLEAGIIYIF